MGRLYCDGHRTSPSSVQRHLMRSEAVGSWDSARNLSADKDKKRDSMGVVVRAREDFLPQSTTCLDFLGKVMPPLASLGGGQRCPGVDVL